MEIDCHTDFKTVTIDHSDTPPHVTVYYTEKPGEFLCLIFGAPPLCCLTSMRDITRILSGRFKMRLAEIIGLTLTAVLVAFTACISPKVSPTVSSNVTDQVAGEQFVRKILDSLQESSGWTPPLPPTGGQKPRALTKEEKDKVLAIASAVPQVIAVKQDKDVVSVDTSFLWVGWNGHPDGESFLNYEPVENGIVDLSNKGDTWYPAADFRFHSRFGEYKVGIKVAVNLETGKVVWLGGYVSFPIPPKIPPASSS